MADREVTVGELADDIRELSEELRGFRRWADERLVTREVYDAHREANAEQSKVIDHRLTAVEGRQTWIARTSVTALILPILVPIMVGIILVTVGLASAKP